MPAPFHDLGLEVCTRVQPHDSEAVSSCVSVACKCRPQSSRQRWRLHEETMSEPIGFNRSAAHTESYVG